MQGYIFIMVYGDLITLIPAPTNWNPYELANLQFLEIPRNVTHGNLHCLKRTCRDDSLK